MEKSTWFSNCACCANFSISLSFCLLNSLWCCALVATTKAKQSKAHTFARNTFQVSLCVIFLFKYSELYVCVTATSWLPLLLEARKTNERNKETMGPPKRTAPNVNAATFCCCYFKANLILSTATSGWRATKFSLYFEREQNQCKTLERRSTFTKKNSLNSFAFLSLFLSLFQFKFWSKLAHAKHAKHF